MSETLLDVTEEIDSVEESTEDQADQIHLIPFTGFEDYIAADQAGPVFIQYLMAHAVHGYLAYGKPSFFRSGDVVFVRACDLAWPKGHLRKVLATTQRELEQAHKRNPKDKEAKANLRQLQSILGKKNYEKRALVFGFPEVNEEGATTLWVGGLLLYNEPTGKGQRLVGPEYQDYTSPEFLNLFLERGGEIVTLHPPASEYDRMGIILETAKQQIEKIRSEHETTTHDDQTGTE